MLQTHPTEKKFVFCIQVWRYLLSDRHSALLARFALDEDHAAVAAAAAGTLDALVGPHPEDDVIGEAAGLAPAAAPPPLRPCCLERSGPGGPWETLEELAGETLSTLPRLLLPPVVFRRVSACVAPL